MAKVAKQARVAANSGGGDEFVSRLVPRLPESQRGFALEKLAEYEAKIAEAREHNAQTLADWVSHSRPYRRAGLVSIDEVLANVGGSVSVNGVPATCASWRIRLYAAKGVRCANCGLVGTTFAVERAKRQESNKHHLNLYHVAEDGKETMITVDHIIPKSKGGGNHISNLQPLCIRCNGRKGDKLPEHRTIEGEAA